MEDVEPCFRWNKSQKVPYLSLNSREEKHCRDFRLLALAMEDYLAGAQLDGIHRNSTGSLLI